MVKQKYKPAKKKQITGIKQRYFRERQGMTIKELAEETGVIASYIGKFERNELSLPKDQAIKISNALGVSYAQMMEPYTFEVSVYGTAKKPKVKNPRPKNFEPDKQAPTYKKRKKRKSEKEMDIELDNKPEETETINVTSRLGNPATLEVPVESSEEPYTSGAEVKLPDWLVEQATCQNENSLPEAVSVEIINGIPHISVTGYAEVVFTTQGVASPRVELK